MKARSTALNWAANRAISGWDGVTIASNRVSKLELESGRMNGAIPAELGNLANLKTLVIGNNLVSSGLTGAIPAELGNLANLKTLVISRNLRMTGGIPAELGNLANLEVLSIYLNFQLEGEIPAELGNLANLETLNLYQNYLSGDIPAELGNLANLNTMYLHANRLTNIPAELGSLAKLETLNLRNNSLTSATIPAELGNLANLKLLYINDSGLGGKIPAELGNLAKLERLVLEDNRLSGEIPPELGKLAKLERLNLYANYLTGEIPEELGNLANIQYGELDLRYNNLTGCIPRSLGGKIFATNQRGGVRLSYCAAPTPTPTATSAPDTTATPTPTAVPIAEQCSNGTAAPNPDRNTGLVSDCVALLTAKSTLEGADGNLNWSANLAITDWDGITTTSNRVTSLDLDGGDGPDGPGLNGEIPAELGSLANLEYLRISFFGVTGAIPAELGNLANLEYLMLEDNLLTGDVPAQLGNLSNLKRLDFSHNNLTGCIPQSLRAAAANPYYRTQFSGFTLPFCAATSAPATPTPTATSAPRPPRPTITPTPTSAPRETPVATHTPTATPAIVIETTPTPTATPVSGETPVATPTPTATPAIVIETTPSPSPTPTATPASVVITTDNPCINRLTGNGSANASWTSACVSANPPNAYDYYARFYTFTLDAASEVTITLSSEDAAPYLYLLNGATTAGSINRETGAANASSATITETLQPGAYTIDATTYHAQTPGDFTLEFAATPAPAATCAESLTGNASVNGAWTPACLSANPPNARDYYARFYTFTLDAASQVTITLSSEDAAPYLYLLNGAGTGGAIERETGSANASAATITQTLQPGAYTIDATTYYSETAGDFTLELEIAR